MQLEHPVQVSAGYWHVCVVDQTSVGNQVKCWGAGEAGESGAYDKGQSDVPALVNPMQVSAGQFFSCALDDTDGDDWADEVACWGDDTHNQNVVPNHLIDNPYQIALAQDTACVLADDVICWGANHGGLISNMPSFINPVALSAAEVDMCVLDATGSGYEVVCWGGNRNGIVSDVPGDMAFPYP